MKPQTPTAVLLALLFGQAVASPDMTTAQAYTVTSSSFTLPTENPHSTESMSLQAALLTTPSIEHEPPFATAEPTSYQVLPSEGYPPVGPTLTFPTIPTTLLVSSSATSQPKADIPNERRYELSSLEGPGHSPLKAPERRNPIMYPVGYPVVYLVTDDNPHDSSADEQQLNDFISNAGIVLALVGVVMTLLA
ncbi:hypothetical protein F4821DRAFT_254225 [Hypoxylon rubiginosum]|uniref:Uncharacterized protein n=1 Tax=Hypoxylon rubiginosum TaxID=110542 RepID=A0ACC0DH91_9PEZI|nr:hypothetical protein F4821DRAFT_254225 [Hypoxylon rubiginosum]